MCLKCPTLNMKHLCHRLRFLFLYMFICHKKDDTTRIQFCWRALLLMLHFITDTEP